MRGAFTTVVPVLDGHAEELETLLNAIGQDIQNAKQLPVTDLMTVHFARWVLLPSYARGKVQLVFETNYDGTEREHFTELRDKLLPGLKAIFGHCEGYDPQSDRDGMGLVAFWKKHRLRPLAFYRAYPGLGVSEIRRQAALREDFEERLDAIRKATGGGSKPTIQEVAAAPGPGGRAPGRPDRPSRLPPSPWTLAATVAVVVLLVLSLIGAVGLGALFVVTLPWPDSWIHRHALEADRWPWWVAAILLGTVGILLGRLAVRWKERTEEIPEPVRTAAAPKLRAREDFQTQNQLTHIVPLKPGPFRKFLAVAVLTAIGLLARIYFVRGRLGSVSSIHFARWVLLPDRRLLFTSNYDGSWESYLGDFVNLVAVGLTAVWSNTQGFPPARFLIQDGARHERDFKRWARACQILTQVWYTAHPGLSVPNILQNRELERAWWGGRVTPRAASLMDRI